MSAHPEIDKYKKQLFAGLKEINNPFGTQQDAVVIAEAIFQLYKLYTEKSESSRIQQEIAGIAELALQELYPRLDRSTFFPGKFKKIELAFLEFLFSSGGNVNRLSIDTTESPSLVINILVNIANIPSSSKQWVTDKAPHLVRFIESPVHTLISGVHARKEASFSAAPVLETMFTMHRPMQRYLRDWLTLHNILVSEATARAISADLMRGSSAAFEYMVQNSIKGLEDNVLLADYLLDKSNYATLVENSLMEFQANNSLSPALRAYVQQRWPALTDEEISQVTIFDDEFTQLPDEPLQPFPEEIPVYSVSLTV